MRYAFCLPTVLLAATVAAQPDHFTSSPYGYENVEGSTSVDLIGKESLLRYQQIDATNLGSKHDRNRILFRRDGLLPDNPDYGARTLDMEVVMAESDLSNISKTFANNYIAGTDSIVLTRKRVSLPDWTQAPVLAPQPESAGWVVMFDNQWSYGGKNATGNDMLWEVRCYANDQAGKSYPMDADPVVQAAIKSASSALGSGCVTAGQSRGVSSTVDITNHGTKFVVDLGVRRAAPSQPAAMLLGISANTQSLGWCADLQINPLVVVPLANTDASGGSLTTIDPVAYNAGMVGTKFYGQAIALDPNQVAGISLGDGRETTVPGDPSPNSKCKYLFALSPTAATATGGQDGGIIIHTNHP